MYKLNAKFCLFVRLGDLNYCMEYVLCEPYSFTFLNVVQLLVCY